MKPVLITFFALLAIQSCQRSEQLTLKTAQDQTSHSYHPGKELMIMYCLSCHKPQGDHQGRLAPPMAMVKQHYFTEGMEKKEFVEKIMKWVEDPNWDHLQMYGAARRFGIMPKQGFPEDSIKLIAEYIYDNQFEKEPECNDGSQPGKRRDWNSN